MANKINCLRVFIASPGGLADERKAFREEIQDYNEAESIPRGVLFQPVGWEDTLGAVGRPQTIINEDVCASDYFILLLWNRWGSPPGTRSLGFTSGTEEEYPYNATYHFLFATPSDACHTTQYNMKEGGRQ